MPSLKAGTNWTFSGNVYKYNTTTSSSSVVSATFFVQIASVSSNSTTYSDWDGSSLVSGYIQQFVTLIVEITISGITEIVTLAGNFLNGKEAVGTGKFYSNRLNNKDAVLELSIISSTAVCDGRQSAKMEYTTNQPGVDGTIIISSVIGYNCRNN